MAVITKRSTTRLMKETLTTMSLKGKEYPAAKFLLCTWNVREDTVTGHQWCPNHYTSFTTILDPSVHRNIA